MKTKKLWIFSFIFGLLATVCFYFFIAESKPKPAIAATTATPEKKAAAANTDNQTDTLKISNGKRAISIPVKDAEGIAGYIKAGAHVDVLANMTPPKSAPANQEEDARILLQNVKVLAVGAATDAPADRKKYKLVTLEVTPREGLALGFATKYDLYLMLRNDTDADLEKTTTHIHETDLHEGVFSN